MFWQLSDMGSIFTKIINREIPADVVYEDDVCLAFRDVNPQAPTHILVIPKTAEIDSLASAKDEHQEILGHLLLVSKKIAHAKGLKDFRLVINNGEGAGQSVFHLHIHILGGREFLWPPG